jgi:hypothetical protein
MRGLIHILESSPTADIVGQYNLGARRATNNVLNQLTKTMPTIQDHSALPGVCIRVCHDEGVFRGIPCDCRSLILKGVLLMLGGHPQVLRDWNTRDCVHGVTHLSLEQISWYRVLDCFSINTLVVELSLRSQEGKSQIERMAMSPLGTRVEQTSPEICSITTIFRGSVQGNSSVGLLWNVVVTGRVVSVNAQWLLKNSLPGKLRK